MWSYSTKTSSVLMGIINGPPLDESEPSSLARLSLFSPLTPISPAAAPESTSWLKHRCLITSLGLEKVISHTLHLYGLPEEPRNSASIWLESSAAHSSMLCRSTMVYAGSEPRFMQTCRAAWLARQKLLPQALQRYGFPVWMYMCSLQWLFWMNLRPQVEHSYFLRFTSRSMSAAPSRLSISAISDGGGVSAWGWAMYRLTAVVVGTGMAVSGCDKSFEYRCCSLSLAASTMMGVAAPASLLLRTSSTSGVAAPPASIVEAAPTDSNTRGSIAWVCRRRCSRKATRWVKRPPQTWHV